MGEDELTDDEKTKILQDLHSDKLDVFLTRYRKYLKPADCDNFDKSDDFLVQMIVKQIRGQKEVTVKEKRNRRFNAMQQLLKDGVFFSDSKMREREPYLYDAMIGKFLNQEEQMEHLRPTVSRDQAECTWSTLLDRLEDSAEIAERRNLQEMEWEGGGGRRDDGGKDHISRFMAHVANQTDEFVPEEEEEEQQKEKEEDDEIEKMRKEMERLAKIEADQYDELADDDTPLVLRQEFETFMQQKFLAGKDTLFYDYSLCDLGASTDPIREREDEERWVDRYRVPAKMHKNSGGNSNSNNNNGGAGGPETRWHYLGPDRESYGPYCGKDMMFWLQTGYFNESLQVRTENESAFHTLGEWTQLVGNHPFAMTVHSFEATANQINSIRPPHAPMLMMPPGLPSSFPPPMQMRFPPFVMPLLHQMNNQAPMSMMHSQPPSEPIDAGSLSHTPDSDDFQSGHGHGQARKLHNQQHPGVQSLIPQMMHAQVSTEPIQTKEVECQTEPLKLELSKDKASRLLSDLFGQLVVIN
ncbi:unnamed protein product [Caenorhabditis sp. 36 PRJEB53466]|nr:unnamed protein product [Caenorhabditis sp. 36 PRJEB53466]